MVPDICRAAFGAALMSCVLPALADEGQNSVTVTGSRLDDAASTANRMGLTQREIPATLDVVSQETIQALGLRTSTEAYNAAPGVRAGDIPGALGSTSMRGFGSNGVSFLIDGVRMTNAALASRAWDTWNFERIEVLKGPSSVMFGEGVLAGAINLVTRKPDLSQRHLDAMLNAGSFDSVRAGVGVNQPVTAHLAIRGDVSYNRSSGFVADTASKSAAATTSLFYKPDDRLLVEASFDYYYDDYGTAYFGVPLVPTASARRPSDIVTNSAGLVVDKALRYQNYDVTDGLMDSDTYWLRTRIAYSFNEQWRFTNELGYYDAERRWANAEDYTFNAASGLLDRTTTKIFHDQQFWMDRAFASWDSAIGGRRNRMSFGVEYSSTDFGTNRRFGTTSAVDPDMPVRGRFPADTAANFPDAGNRVDFESQADVTAFFAENAFNLTPRWLWVGGVRYDDIQLDRAIVDLNTGALTAFEQDYDPLSWRLGTVFDIAQNFQVYAQYSYAVTPIGALLLISQTHARFDLTTGDSVEVGIKSSFLDDRIALTASVYRLEQNDILTRDPANPAMTLQGGSQKAEGVELSWAAGITEHLRIDGNVAVLTTEFTKLLEAGGVNRAGHRPANVPEQTAALNAYYRLPAWPVTVGVSAQHAGDFFTSNSNAYRVEGHTTLNASVSYDSPFGRWTLRGRNLTNEFYADWSGFSATQVYLGAPRTVELGFTTRL